MILDFNNYSLELSEKTFSVFIKGVRMFKFPVSSAVDKYEEPRSIPTGSSYIENGITEDEDFKNFNFKTFQDNGKTVAEYITSSNLWDEKVYKIEADEKGFSYEISVKGEGTVNRIRYFKSKYEKTGYEAAGYLLPHAGQYKESECLRNVFENSQIAFDYFAPGPFVYPFYAEELDGWFGIGLFAEKGEHNFDRFVYEKGMNFVLPLDNRLKINGTKKLPGIWGGYGENAFGVLTAYSDWYFDSGIAKRHSDYNLDPKWWRGPIFCGWGEEQKLGRENNSYAADFATQENYDKMINTLEQNGIKPKIIIIDAKWQKGMGNIEVDTKKWPDMRSFVDKMHGKGKKVLLWIKSWDCEGLPKNECIDNLCNPVAADPTNPEFIKNTKLKIHKLLSPENECYNCDGFKIDFMNCIPKGETLRPYDGKSYGIELIKKWLGLIYGSAKETKTDALINASCAHPYTADVCNQIRIHDYQGALRSSVEVMTFRKKIAEAVYGNITIDTDSGGTESHRDFLRYIKAQPKIGVPDLYFVTSSLGTPMDKSDYELIKRTWDEYIKDNNL